MRIVFTAEALRQLDAVLSYLTDRNPRGARNVLRRMRTVVDLLAEHPLVGSATNRSGQRRIVVNPYPYVIFYRIDEDQVIIQQIRHASRRPL